MRLAAVTIGTVSEIVGPPGKSELIIELDNGSGRCTQTRRRVFGERQDGTPSSRSTRAARAFGPCPSNSRLEEADAFRQRPTP